MTLWSDLDAPVLRHLLEQPPNGEILMTNWRSVEARPEFPAAEERAFHVAVERLQDAGYVTSSKMEWDGGGGVYWMNFLVTGTGKQALGEWPLFDALGDPGQLAALLERLVDDAPTSEERTNIRRAAEIVRTTAPAALSAAARGALLGLARAHGIL